MKRIVLLLIGLMFGLNLIAHAQLNGGVGSAESAYQYNYISTASTTTVKSGPGILHNLMVSGGTAGTIIVYNNTAASGPIISSFDSTNAIANYSFNVVFSSGCTVVTGAATKVTVSYL